MSMEPILFASDLDNTLLFSIAHRQEGDRCVEWLDGKEQGFLTPDAVSLLETVHQLTRLIPVTTRSVAQYLRIRFPEPVTPAYAVAANGAVLLHHGQPDAAWEAETQALLTPWLPELERMEAAIPQRLAGRRLRRVDGAYLFLSCPDPEDAAYCRSCLTDTTLSVETTGRKLYLFPPPVNKGAAVARLRRRFSPSGVIGAGDSAIDVPMLRECDWAIAPHDVLVEGMDRDRVAVWDGQGRFPDYVLQQAAAFARAGQ